MGREDFRVDAGPLRRGLIDDGHVEPAGAGTHAAAAGALLPIHLDPFDRMLVTQAQLEGLPPVTRVPVLGRYPGAVRVEQVGAADTTARRAGPTQAGPTPQAAQARRRAGVPGGVGLRGSRYWIAAIWSGGRKYMWMS
jgi:hypothetical protein